jgi:hypothetical protein
MDKDGVVQEILRLVFGLPRKERLETLSAAWMTVSQDDLADGWSDGRFEQTQERQLDLLDGLRDLVSDEPDTDLLRWRAEFERATEESDLAEVERLKKELWGKLNKGEKHE